MPRNRQFYQTDLLYVGPTGSNPASGQLYPGAVWGQITGSVAGAGVTAGSAYFAATGGSSYIAELFRVQKCDNGWDKKLKILNEFGQLSQVDLVPIDPPDVNLSFSYVLSNLENENLIGFTCNKAGDTTQVSCISGILNQSTSPKNYFIKTTAEGTDAINNNSSDYDVVSFGNAFIASYTAQGRVLDFPTADVSIAAINMQAQHVWQAPSGGVTTPAVYIANAGYITGWGYVLPTGVTSANNLAVSTTNVSGLSVLRPGDITFNLGLNVNGAVDGFSSPTDMKIQSFNISVNLALEDLAQLGSKFYYAKLPKFPVEATLTINTLAGDFQSGTLVEIYNNNASYNPIVYLNLPGAGGTGPIGASVGSTPVVSYQLKNAKLESQKYGLAIGSNKTMDLTFKTVIGSPTDTVNGLFMSGITANI